MESLVLNIAETPVSVVPIRRAVTLVLSDKAIVRANYENTIFRSASIVMPIPSVIQCTKSVYIPKRFTDILPFNRKNVYLRDAGHCQYCGKKVSLSSMSFDHVIPKCQGGTACWTNIVISCTKCNATKGRKLTSRFKEPLRKPYAPRLSRAAPAYIVNKLVGEIPIETWTDYIYWEIILES